MEDKRPFNTVSNLILITTAMAMVIILLLLSGSTRIGHLIFLAGAAVLLTLGVRLLRQQGHHRLAGMIYIGGLSLLLTLLISQTWQPGSFLPYLFAIPIILSPNLLSPPAGPAVWLLTTLLSLIGVATRAELTTANRLDLAIPAGVNLLVAIVSYFTATERQTLQSSLQQAKTQIVQYQSDLQTTQQALAHLQSHAAQASAQAAPGQEAIEAVNLARNRFLRNISHELRTPLNGIINFSHMIGLGFYGEVNTHQLNYLKRVEQSGWYMINMLSDLSDMVKIETGEFKLDPAQADLRTLCEEALENLFSLALDNEVALVRDYPAEWPKVVLDAQRIKQVLINMLRTAAKSTESGHIALRVRADGQYLYILVEDTGTGLTPEQQADFQRPLQEANGRLGQQRLGEGLGISIARYLVEAHGGILQLQSQAGRGTTFNIVLPLQPNSTGAQAP